MKQLIFLRHAKSDWGNEQLKDIDRHLNERGYRDAYFQSEWFSKKQAHPDLILCSTATRALSTALIFARALDFNMQNFELEKTIYESSVENIIALIKAQSNHIDSIMLVGHNPTFTEICNVLSGELYFDNIPTCGIVSIKFDVSDWNKALSDKGKIDYYQFPKNFKIQE